MSNRTSRGAPEILVETDRAEHQSEADREDGLRNVVAAEADEGREGEKHQREDFRRAERQRDIRQERREEGEKHVGHGSAHEGGQCGGDEREARPPLPRQRPSVEGRGDGRRTRRECRGVIDEIAPPYIAP